MLLWLLACRPEPAPQPQPADPQDTVDTAPLGLDWMEAPELFDPANSVRLAKELRASTSLPTSATLTIRDGEQVRVVHFDGVNTEHNLPVLGLIPDHEHVVDVVFIDAAGNTLEASLDLTTSTVDLSLPVATVLTSDLTLAEPGYTWCPVRTDTILRLVAYDLQGRPRWVQRRPGTLFALSQRPDGFITGLAANSVFLDDLLGSGVTSWSTRESADVHIAGVPEIHHDVVWNDDGSFWTLTTEELEVDNYPLSTETPYDFGPASIKGDVAIHVRADGTIAQRIAVADIIGTQHISASSHDLQSDGLYDWSHANAVVPIPKENALLISLRHQDAVLRIDLATESLDWILSRPEGWPTSLSDKLLTPLGEPFLWPTHAHAPTIHGDQLTLFDNGNGHRRSPYVEDEGLGQFSRLVSYRIDAEARTIEQVWEKRGGSDGPLYSQALGNADVLPNGNIFGTYAYLRQDGGPSNEANGLGTFSIRLIEVNPTTDAVAWELRLNSDIKEHPGGWLVDRCTRVASLYPEGMETIQ